jgi:hypothetical protein
MTIGVRCPTSLAHLQRFPEVGLAGLEPVTSWVRYVRDRFRPVSPSCGVGFSSGSAKVAGTRRNRVRFPKCFQLAV